MENTENTVLQVYGDDVIPSGEYTLTVTGHKNYTHAQYGASIIFQLVVDAGPYQGTQLSAFAPAEIRGKNKLYKYLTAMGFAMTTGMRIDLSQAKGRRVKAIVLADEKKDGTPYNKVEHLMPLGMATPQPVAQPVYQQPVPLTTQAYQQPQIQPQMAPQPQFAQPQPVYPQQAPQPQQVALPANPVSMGTPVMQQAPTMHQPVNTIDPVTGLGF